MASDFACGVGDDGVPKGLVPGDLVRCLLVAEGFYDDGGWSVGEEHVREDLDTLVVGDAVEEAVAALFVLNDGAVLERAVDAAVDDEFWEALAEAMGVALDDGLLSSLLETVETGCLKVGAELAADGGLEDLGFGEVKFESGGRELLLGCELDEEVGSCGWGGVGQHGVKIGTVGERQGCAQCCWILGDACDGLVAGGGHGMGAAPYVVADLLRGLVRVAAGEGSKLGCEDTGQHGVNSSFAV